MKLSFLAIAVLISVSIFGGELILETGELSFTELTENSYRPVVHGFSLQTVENHPEMPYKTLLFNSEVKRVEIVEKEIISPPGKIAKGKPRYLYSPIKASKIKTDPSYIFIPTPKNFYKTSFLGTKSGEKIYNLNFYPLIKRADGKFLFIKKIKIEFAGDKIARRADLRLGVDRELLIITTNAIVSNSSKLEEFISAKKSFGFSVDIATENEFGTGTGHSKAIKIREYIKTVRDDYNFLLLIGNPHPENGDIPMLRPWPLENYNDQSDPLPQMENIKSAPTDTFYAELDGNWDLDGDGKFGVHPNDQDEGGVEFTAELIVGRIPVYSDSYSNLDKILEKSTAYMRGEGDLSYRKKVLFPGAIGFFESQDPYNPVPHQEGSFVAEHLRSSLFEANPAHPEGDLYSLTTLYETEVPDYYPHKSPYTPDYPLTKENLLSEWKKGYGIVYWLGHGMPTNTSRVFVRYNQRQEEEIISSSDTSTLPFNTPSFVFMGSCLNGQPDSSDNIAYQMLLNGAVGVIAASNVSHGVPDKNYAPENDDAGIFAFGTYFVKALVEEEFPAKVLSDNKAELFNNVTDNVMWNTKMELNYLGDPTLKILNIAEEPDTPDEDIAADEDGTYDSDYYYESDDSKAYEDDPSYPDSDPKKDETTEDSDTSTEQDSSKLSDSDDAEDVTTDESSGETGQLPDTDSASSSWTGKKDAGCSCSLIF